MIPRRRVLATLAAAAFAARRATLRAQTLQKLFFAGVPTDDMTPVFYAIRNGLYSRAGLDVEVVPTQSGTVATEAIMVGTYQLGKGSLIAGLVAHLKGLPITFVGNENIWTGKSPFSQMIVASDSTVKTGADLNGQTLGAAGLNDLNTMAMAAWIDKTGGDSRTVKWIEIPNSAAGAAVADHRIAAGMIQEPGLSAAIATGKVRALAPAYDAIGTNFVLTAYLAQKQWAEQNAATLKKWLDITYEAATYTNAHEAETAPMMSEVTKIPLAIISKMWRSTGATNGNPELIQPMIDAAAKYHLIPRRFAAKEMYFNG